MNNSTKWIIGGVALVAVAFLTKKWWMPKKSTVTSDVKKTDTATTTTTTTATAPAPAPAPAAPLRPLARVAPNLAVAANRVMSSAPAMVIDSER